MALVKFGLCIQRNSNNNKLKYLH